jgi:hypothetical protein
MWLLPVSRNGEKFHLVNPKIHMVTVAMCNHKLKLSDERTYELNDLPGFEKCGQCLRFSAANE